MKDTDRRRRTTSCGRTALQYRGRGLEAIIAGDGESALDEMSKQTFDAIVLDIMLPGIDGFEVARDSFAIAKILLRS